MPIGMPGGPPQGGGYADQMRSRLPMGPGGAPSPGMPPMGGAPGMGAGAPGGGQIPIQALIQLLMMLLQKGGGAPMPGGAMPPGVPPMAMMPNKPPGAY